MTTATNTLWIRADGVSKRLLPPMRLKVLLRRLLGCDPLDFEGRRSLGDFCFAERKGSMLTLSRFATVDGVVVPDPVIDVALSAHGANVVRYRDRWMESHVTKDADDRSRRQDRLNRFLESWLTELSR